MPVYVILNKHYIVCILRYLIEKYKVVCYNMLSVSNSLYKLTYLNIMNIDPKVLNFLVDKFDLSETEAQLYIGLLKKGPSTVMDISRFTGINRATAHINLEDLIKKGFVNQTKKPNSKRRILVAERPDKLEFILKERKRKVERTLGVLPDIVTQLKSMKSDDTGSEVLVEYYKGKFEVENIYDEVLQADEIRSYVNVEKVFEVFPENEEKFTSAYKSREDMYMWEILNSDNPYANSISTNRYKYKFFPKKVDLSALDYIIYDGKIAIIKAVDEPTGIVIKSDELYESSVDIYDFVWSLLPEPKKTTR